MPRSSTRDQILDAATAILLRDGSDRLTIANTARECGISKGGLFYHFGSKQELLEGLVDRLVGRFDAAIGAADDVPGAATRAYLDATLADVGGLTRPATALFGTAMRDPTLLERLRDRYSVWQRRLNADGIDPSVALLVRLTADGLWVAESFDLEPPTPGRRREIGQRLSAMVDAAAGSAAREGTSAPAGGRP